MSVIRIWFSACLGSILLFVFCVFGAHGSSELPAIRAIPNCKHVVARYLGPLIPSEGLVQIRLRWLNELEDFYANSPYGRALAGRVLKTLSALFSSPPSHPALSEVLALGQDFSHQCVNRRLLVCEVLKNGTPHIIDPTHHAGFIQNIPGTLNLARFDPVPINTRSYIQTTEGRTPEFSQEVNLIYFDPRIFQPDQLNFQLLISSQNPNFYEITQLAKTYEAQFLAGVLLHELQHYLDTLLIYEWIYKNIRLIRIGKSPHILFQKFVRVETNGTLSLHHAFVRIFFESRAYMVQLKVMEELVPLNSHNLSHSWEDYFRALATHSLTSIYNLSEEELEIFSFLTQHPFPKIGRANILEVAPAISQQLKESLKSAQLTLRNHNSQLKNKKKKSRR